MSLFKKVRKLLGLLFVLILMAASVVAYQNREIFNPIIDAYWAFTNKPEQPLRFQANITGEVIKVLDGNWFHIKIPEGFVYAVRITGMEAPALGRVPDPLNPPLGNLSRTNLTELLLDKTVKINILEMNDTRYGQGFVYLNTTNIAQFMVSQGMARLNRQEILGLKVKEKYRLAQAERLAIEQNLGVYETGETFDWATIQASPEASPTKKTE
ncbi:MAG: hypothetical protein M2R45_00419 [Verrucomicrobia subdivision 3 bacterium]|nr:hypothetical protein [Limisphaerales bacterium]MCS1413701.1 hypothetical protein [Limisphaerales bacterium]